MIAAVVPFTSAPQDLAGLKLELAQAKTDIAQFRAVRERLEDLLTERAIPARRVEEAKADEARAQACSSRPGKTLPIRANEVRRGWGRRWIRLI